MHKFSTIAFLAAIAFLTGPMTIPALAAQKVEGDSTLKDLQPAGVSNKHLKHQKHQVYDLTFDASGNEYTCRTNPDKSVNAVDFVVGGGVHYAMDGKKVKISTPGDKKVDCQVVRVALISTPARY